MKDTIKELTEGMQRLCDVANRVVQGPVNRIEVDLLLEDLRHLYDVALRLNAAPLPEKEPSPVEEQEMELHDDEKMMAMVSTMAAMAQEPVAPIAPAIAALPDTPDTPEAPEPLPQMEELEANDNALLFDEVIVEPEAQVVPEAPKKPEIPETPVIQEKPAATGQASLLDYLNQPTPRTLGETLSEPHTLSSSLEKKVDDLRTVININDKFSFMSELFKGNMKAYNDFIMHLNALTKRDEAMAHVHEVAAQYKWDEESMAVKTFYKILDKKF